MLGLEVGSQKPSPPACSFHSFWLLPSAALWRHMETVSIYPAPPGCCCVLCSSERKPWIPRRVISEAACKAASCFAGSVWALLHQRRESVTICANRSSWFGGLSSAWGTSLLLGEKFFVTVILYLKACLVGLSFQLLPLLLQVILCSPPWAGCQDPGRVVKESRCCVNL